LPKMWNSFIQMDTSKSGTIEFEDFKNSVLNTATSLSFSSVKERELDHHIIREFANMDRYQTGSVSYLCFVLYMAKSRQADALFKKALKKKAISLCEEYVFPNAPREVNLSNKSRKKIKICVDKGEVSINLFDEAENEILLLLTNDSFKRFKNSILFKKFLASIQTYTIEGSSTLCSSKEKNYANVRKCFRKNTLMDHHYKRSASMSNILIALSAGLFLNSPPKQLKPITQCSSGMLMSPPIPKPSINLRSKNNSKKFDIANNKIINIKQYV